MKHIQKGNPLSEFEECLRKEHPKNWESLHGSKLFPDVVNKSKEHILENEQHMLSGYTERLLSPYSKSTHIDHFRKKGLSWSPSVEFDWDNFIVDERNDEYGAVYKDKNTSSVDDYKFLLNPVVDYPENFFTYNVEGEILPREGLSELDSNRAAFSIKRFNLSHKSLCCQRKSILKEIISYRDGNLSDDEIRNNLKDHPFPSFIKWALDELL